jgi:hypothetical protein
MPGEDLGPMANDSVVSTPSVEPLTRAELGRAIVKLCADNGFHGVLAAFVGPSGYWVTHTAGMETWGLLKVAELALTDSQRERDRAFNSPQALLTKLEQESRPK